MAVKTIHENPSIQIVILDRTLAGDLAHLIWSVAKAMEEDGFVCSKEKIQSMAR